MSEKIKPHHLERKALLDVRQSSAYQVHNNLESQKLQYAMQERLYYLGWSEVEVVDEDLGRSASGSVTRAGFERMVAQVCLGQVGAVAAREVSRFARNSREWQKLVEVCRVVDTLLIDQEMYTPRQSNDRLLLGLKGSLNEYELDLLRQRSVEARREKARRGELIVASPAGYVKGEEARLEKDPIAGFKKVCRWSSANSSNSAQHARRYCGFWNMACRCLSPPRAARWLATPSIQHDLQPVEQPGLRRRLCLRKNGTHHAV